MFECRFFDPIESLPRDNSEKTGNELIEMLSQVSWADEIDKVHRMPPDRIFYWPAFQVRQAEFNESMMVCAIDDDEDWSFTVFYQRAQTVKRFFGLGSKEKPDYTSMKKKVDLGFSIRSFDAFIHDKREHLSTLFSKPEAKKIHCGKQYRLICPKPLSIRHISDPELVSGMIDYSNYTYEQLEDSLEHIDREKFPDRLALIHQAIARYPAHS